MRCFLVANFNQLMSETNKFKNINLVNSKDFIDQSTNETKIFSLSNIAAGLVSLMSFFNYTFAKRVA